MTNDSPAGGAEPPVADRPVVLNIGCGIDTITRLHDYFPPRAWRELRLDIDPGVRPDIVASITDMAVIPDGAVDAVWSSHNLEHLNPHEVPCAAAECLRVLKPGGRVLIAVPDLQAVAEEIAAGRIGQPLYHSDAGPITALDIIYGYGVAIAAGKVHMAHRTGFTPDSLGGVLTAAGFAPVVVHQMPGYELMAMGFRPPAPEDLLTALSPPFAPTNRRLGSRPAP
ncbi:class I SAM-dependent methyltransferase [Azospirillum himalayense]|uniref:Class I SAM-dependent methyltransferase n=1 Tax=Azospirillum himalayense TaxID=654847 RepID=A0ABW0FZU4_9PROT